MITKLTSKYIVDVNDPTLFLNYLTSRKWKLVNSPREGLLVFNGPEDDHGEPIVQVLPKSSEYDDYPMRARELVNALSVIEDRPVEEVIRDIKASGDNLSVIGGESAEFAVVSTIAGEDFTPRIFGGDVPAAAEPSSGRASFRDSPAVLSFVGLAAASVFFAVYYININERWNAAQAENLALKKKDDVNTNRLMNAEKQLADVTGLLKTVEQLDKISTGERGPRLLAIARDLNTDGEVRRRAVEFLGLLDETDSVSALASIIDEASASREQRKAAIETLRKWGFGARAALPALRKIKGDTDEDLAAVAVNAIDGMTANIGGIRFVFSIRDGQKYPDDAVSITILLKNDVVLDVIPKLGVGAAWENSTRILDTAPLTRRLNIEEIEQWKLRVKSRDWKVARAHPWSASLEVSLVSKDKDASGNPKVYLLQSIPNIRFGGPVDQDQIFPLIADAGDDRREGGAAQ